MVRSPQKTFRQRVHSSSMDDVTLPLCENTFAPAARLSYLQVVWLCSEVRVTVDFAWQTIIPFLQVALIDVTLAGDNAVVIAMVVRPLSPPHRRIALATGILGGAILRIVLALFATRLLDVIGLTFAGGLLLLWVCWKMYAELVREEKVTEIVGSNTLWQSIVRVLLADISMSLDNVLAVAGAARGHPQLIIMGLAASVLLMAFAASFIARVLAKHKWIAWVGLAVVAFVALELIYKGSAEIIRYAST